MLYSLNINGKLMEINSPKVMGIINVTPDSFYQGSRCFHPDIIATQVEKMLQDGVDIIDIGGFSTRPNFTNISEKEEIERVDMAFNIIKKMTDIPISVDTFRSAVIEKMYANYGGFIVNDISGGKFDTKMIGIVGKYKLPYILMLNSDSLDTMFQTEDVSISTHICNLSSTIHLLKENGVQDIIIDPGFGFYKSTYDNFNYLQELPTFTIFDYPLLMGVSRKSMIWKVLNIAPAESLNGTTIIHTFGILSGGKILRVHDVKEAKEVIELCQLLTR